MFTACNNTLVAFLLLLPKGFECDAVVAPRDDVISLGRRCIDAAAAGRRDASILRDGSPAAAAAAVVAFVGVAVAAAVGPPAEAPPRTCGPAPRGRSDASAPTRTSVRTSSINAAVAARGEGQRRDIPILNLS